MLQVGQARIAAGASLSGVVDTGGLRLAAIQTPSGWDAADITLQASVDGTNFFNVHVDESDTEYTIQAAASRYIALPMDAVEAPFLKIRSGTSAAAVNQADAVVLNLVFVVP